MTKYAFVSAERANHAVAMLCRVLGVSVSGFYARLHAIPPLPTRAEAEAELRGPIGPLLAPPRPGLRPPPGPRRPPRPPDSRHDLPVAPNLLARDFTAEKPDQVWLADIS